MARKRPDWFTDWHNKEFYHFQLEVKHQLKLHSKLLWIILGGLITLTLLERFVGWISLVRGLLG